MPGIPVPLTILRALADETLRRLELAAQIEQPGESGRAREQMLIAFIEQLVPSSFGVSTGFVVDALGEKSKQVDVVVYHTDYAPAFEIGGVKHFRLSRSSRWWRLRPQSTARRISGRRWTTLLR
jgi:hypothetical protein